MALHSSNIANFPSRCYLRLFFSLALVACLLSSFATVNGEDNMHLGSSFAVQAGLYVGPIQSNRMAEQLISAGYAAWVEERPQGQGQMLYFVLVGPFGEEAQAYEAVRSIASKFQIEPFIVDLNKR